MRAIWTMCVATGFILANVLIAAPVVAQDSESGFLHACNTGTGKAAVDGCTWIIQSNKFSGGDLAVAYARRGDALSVYRQYARAVEDYTQAIKLKPDYAVAIFNRGSAYGFLRDYARSVEDFTVVIALQPKNARAYVLRAISLRHLNKNARAVEDLDKAIHLDPNDGYAFNERAWVRAIMGHLDAALADCRQADHLKPNDKHVLSTCAFVYFKQAHYAEAVKAANAALTVDSRHADSLFMRGLSKRRAGDGPGGDADIQAAKAIDPKIMDTYAGYGVKP